jgi:hypothetical protein
LERGRPKASSAITGPLGPLFHPIHNANAIANCFENQFTAHNLCDCDHRQQVEATVQALLATVDEGTSVKFRPCDVSKEIQYLKLGTACCLNGIPNKCLRHLPRRPIVHSTHLFNHIIYKLHPSGLQLLFLDYSVPRIRVFRQ